MDLVGGIDVWEKVQPEPVATADNLDTKKREIVGWGFLGQGLPEQLWQLST